MINFALHTALDSRGTGLVSIGAWSESPCAGVMTPGTESEPGPARRTVFSPPRPGRREVTECVHCS